MADKHVTHDKLSGDLVFILKSLKDNGRAGRSNRLADVKGALEPSVSLEFDTYFFFLRKYHYIAMDRDAMLKVTDGGEKLLSGEQQEKFSGEVSDFFVQQLTVAPPGSRTMPDIPLPDRPPAAQDFEEGEQTIVPPGSMRVRKPVFVDEASAPFVHPPPEGRLSGVVPAVPVVAPIPPAAPLQLTSPVVPAASAGEKKGQDLDGRYARLESIGSGPLGTVSKGRQHALGVDVAIKELKDIFGYFSFLQRGDVVKRLKKELCAQAQVRHPSVLTVIDHNVEVARPYFVTELGSGHLRARLDATAGKGLPVRDSIRCFLQIAYGLKAAHSSGLTHHNLKPENVIFDAYGNAKISDFGLSRVIEVDQSKGLPQVFVGTGGMGYMSPELIARNKDAAASADVYGLGIILYEMLTGQIPGRRSPLPSEVNAECPKSIDSIFDKMTQDRIEKRYADIDGVLVDFYGAFPGGEHLGLGDLILCGVAPAARTSA